jgi:hypothetical protein
MSGMNPIDLIVTVCAVLSPATCEETHLVFNWSGSLQQCVMAAPPYIAQWVGEHPKWNAVKWRCEYPHTNEGGCRQSDAGGLSLDSTALLLAILQILVRNRKHRVGLDLDIAHEALL